MNIYQIPFIALLIWVVVVCIFYIYLVIEEKIKLSFLKFIEENSSILIILYVTALFITLIATKKDLALEF